MFDPADPKQSLPDLEEGILQYWKEEDTFKRSIRQRKRGGDVWDQVENKKKNSNGSFSFYDGPPFATGLPHYGHLLAGTIKDVIPRYQTMRGKMVERRFGWDCHGLPIENLIEKEHDIKDKKQIEDMGIGAFNDLCRGSVQRYTAEWRQTVERMGRWVDMDWDYKTMDPEYMESIWWAFAQLHKKDLIYEGHKPMHICPRCATPLSNFEVTQGYKDRSDMSVVMTFPLKEDPKTVLLAWTTTPWSLPGNMWLAMGKKLEYVKVQEGDITYICSKKLVEKLFKNREYEIVGSIDAKDLEGKQYEPLFPYFADVALPSTEKAGKPETYGDRVFKVVISKAVEVSDEEGTGIVHLTSATGEDSDAVAKEQGVDVFPHVGVDGYFIDLVTDFQGMNAKPEGEDPMATDKAVIANLKERGRHFDSYTITHSYPHCWRCDTPLLPYTASSWFVAIDKVKDTMLSSNSKTEWVPDHVRDGRFGQWLENARDWAISRNRYWGSPLPIWRTEDGDDMTVIGSRDEIMQEVLVRFSKVTVLRHAESEGNLVPLYQGELPGTDLTSRGRDQAKDVGAFLAKDAHPVKVIYTSPLARSLQTADALAKKTGAEVVVDDRLREVSFGDWEGKTVDFSDLTFLKERRAHKIESGKPESIYHFDGMETWESVQERVSSFLNEVLPKHRSEHIAIVTHADPVVNMEWFFTGEDPVKLSHRPYPEKAVPKTYFWDHDKKQQLDLHKDTVDDISWGGSTVGIELTMVRHGETDWNKETRIQGSTKDVPLNENGKKQVQELAEKLNKNDYDVIVASDLDRCVQSAEILSKELGIPVETPLSLLQERRYTSWEGRLKDDILEEHPMQLDKGGFAFHTDDPEEGETLSEFINRIGEAYDHIVETYAGKRVLLVGHGGVNRAMKVLAENLAFSDILEWIPNNADATKITLHKRLQRIPEVLDCWFESGSMPYAQEHYPFEMHHQKLKEPPHFPADFIAEGMDQTRGWFYTLTVLGAALFGKSPFEHCVVNGIVLAEDGKKMSKRLKNYPEPLDVAHRHGADAVRFTLMSSPAVRGEDLKFSEKLVEETVRSVLLPLWNTYSFFVTYANSCNFEPIANRRHSVHPLDVWIRAEVQDLVNRMTKELDNYDLSATCNEIHETIDALTNWYVRLSRRRFAGKSESGAEEDRLDALHTLYDVLLTVSQTLAPFCPYITDAIYLNLVPEDHGSIHLTDWPETRELSAEEQMLLQKTRLQRTIVSLGLSLRGEQKVKIRQPLASATVAIPPAKGITLSQEDQKLIRSELNVKALSITQDPGALAEAVAQVDARKVGPRVGGRVQELIQAGKSGDFTVNDDGTVVILDETLTADEVEIVYRGKEGQNAAADKGVVVSMDTNITDDLVREGYARDIIRTVQRLRKESGLEFTDRIALSVDGADDILAAHKELIEQETTSSIGENTGEAHDVEIGDMKVTVKFTKQ